MRSRAFPVLGLLSLLAGAGPLLAQQPIITAPLEPSQLPARTSFYLIWRGSPSAELRHANALMNFWDDPDSVPLRNAFTGKILSDSKKQKDKPALTREDLNESASLLDNPVTIGYLPRPDSAAAAKPATPTTPAAPTPKWNGIFFVYDRRGKEAILSKTVLRMRASDSTDIPKLTNLTVSGVPALKIERKSGITYWAETGHYAVAASESSVFEEILNRLNGKISAHTLADTSVYQEAKPQLGPGILEFFLDLSQLTRLAADSTTPDPRSEALLKALKLDSLHVAAGHLSLEGARTRFQGSILGNTAPGSLFDIWASGTTTPEVLNHISADTVSLNESDIDFVGIYKLLKQMFSQGQNNSPQMFAALESMAQTRLGMPLPDALALTTGEVASIQNSPVLDDKLQVRILGIRNKPDAMKLLRTVMGDKVSSERTEGATTYVKVSLGGAQTSAGVTQFNFYHLAMTPDLLLGSYKAEPIRALLAQPPASVDTALSAKVQSARKQFPDKLNGFSYFDFQKVQWQAVKEKWIADAAKAAEKTKPTDKGDSTSSYSDLLINMNPEAFHRHLHTLSGASWKDTTGLHFDEWID